MRPIRPRPFVLRLSCLALLSFAVTCDDPASLEPRGHDHEHAPPMSRWNPDWEMVSRAVINTPRIGFESQPGDVPSNVIGLTFDDGPDDTNTPRVLDTLMQKNVKATFFINTNNWDGPVDSNTTLKNLIKRIRDEGHQLASHTVSHPHLPTLSDAAIRGEIEGVQNTVNRSDVLGPTWPKITMLRAPFGEPFQNTSDPNFDRVAGIVAQYAVHMGWAIDTFDYNCTSGTATERKNCVVNNFKNAVNGGARGMVLLHSVHAQTADAIGEIIDFWRARGTVQVPSQFWLGEQFVQARFGKSSNELIYGGPPPTCNQTPFGGSARAIPGTIQAEDFDNGGNNCAYMDTTTGNNGNAYRTTENVDIQLTGDTGGGHNIGWVIGGEYLDYTVNVTASGNYKLELRTATTATGKTVDVSVGGVLIADNLAIPNTASYQTYATVTVPSVALTAGTKELKLLFNQNSFNVNWIRFTAVATCTPETDAAFCSRLNKNCGTVSGTDNCGAPRSVASCGPCNSPNVCTANVCQAPCTPETDAAFCSRLGKNCGGFSGTDNCGAPRSVASCGPCNSPNVCTANVCQAPSTQSIFFEAENGGGATTAPMVVVNDASASGGKCIWSGTTGSNSAVPSNGHVTFSFNVTTAGTFKVWGRFLVGPSTTSDDSLWARIDNGTWTQWNDIFPRVGNAGYKWDSEHDTVNGNAVITRNLTAGSHTLEVAYRENGLKMDRFLVTNDLTLVPSP